MPIETHRKKEENEQGPMNSTYLPGYLECRPKHDEGNLVSSC